MVTSCAIVAGIVVISTLACFLHLSGLRARERKRASWRRSMRLGTPDEDGWRPVARYPEE